MEWSDDAIVLSVRPHGETSAIVEALTRALDCALVASDDLVSQARTELDSAEAVFRPLMAQAPQTIRGLEQPIAVWTQARAEE